MSNRSHPRAPLNPVVASMVDFSLTGMVIPKPWFQKLIWEPTGHPYLVAILILADLVYWYIPFPEIDERTNRQTGWNNKFYGHKYEMDYATYGRVIGATKRQTQDAISWLVQQGALTREVVAAWGPGGKKCGQRVFVEPVLAYIKYLNVPIETETDPDRDLPPSHVFGGDGDDNPDLPFDEDPVLGDTADRLPQNCTPSHPKGGDLTEITESKIPHVFNPPPYPPLGEAADAAGAPAALGAAVRLGGGTDGENGEPGEGGANAPDGAPDGAGEAPPHSARPPQPPAGEYPELVAWLDGENCERPGQFLTWGPLPIAQKRYAGKQGLHSPIAGLVKDMQRRPVTQAEWAWYEEQLARATEAGRPIDPTEPTRPPAELVGQALNYGWIDQVRNALVEALAAIGEAPEHFAVTSWPTASRPYACYMIRHEELRLVYRAIEADIRREICRVAGCAGMAIELECVVGTLAGLPALPQARPAVVEPPAPSRAVERVESARPAHRIAAWWSTQEAWDHQLAVAQANKDPQLAVAQLDRLFIHLKNGSWEGGWIVAANKNPRVQRELDTIHRQRIIDLAQAGGQLLNPPAGPPAPAAGPDLSRFSDYRKAG